MLTARARRFGWLVAAALVPLGALAALGLAGCGSGDDDGGVEDDAGLPPALAIVAPGDSIGLAPGERVALRVRYTGGGGEAIAAAPVTWTLRGGDGGTGGSSISTTTTATDAAGEAEVELVAGPERVDIQVTADAPGAGTATFYVSVSASGFALLEVTPRYVGARLPDELARVELRLWGAAEVACADLDVDAPPPLTLAPRTLATWDATAVWPSVVAEEGYTLLVWGAHAASGLPVSVSCVDVPASAVPPAQAALDVAVPDRALVVAPQPVETTLSLAGLDAALDARGAHRPWRPLGCEAGGGQLLLDWLVDALSGDGALDGVTASPAGLGAAIAARRGALGADGCRGLEAGTGPSLDLVLTSLASAGGWPDPAALADVVAVRDDMLTALTLTATLTVDAGAVTHALATATPGATGPIDLAASSRPVIAATFVGAPAVPGAWPLATHGFTLRAGSLLRQAHESWALSGAGLGAADHLGSTLIDAVDDGDTRGCAAVSGAVCEAIDAPATCALAACTAVAVALDGALAAWWRLADGPGLDLSLAGTATLADRDGDLVADPIELGAWTGALTLQDGATVSAPGTFRAADAPPPPPLPTD